MKKVVKLAFVAAFVAVAGYGVYANQTSNAMSDLALANVEALAGCEVSSDPSKNTGVCSGDVNGNREYCVKSSSQWGGGPACSGTI